MKMKNRVLSLFLAMLMLVMSLPLTVLQVSAADGTIPRAVSMSPIDGYSTTEVTLKGKITANGGSEIKRYGFQYGIVGGSKSETKEWSGHLTTGKEVEFELTGLQPNTTIWYYFYAVNSTGTAKDASDRDEKVNGTQYASTLPEIELETPVITFPDSYDDIVAGEDVEFEWDEVDGAEKYEWELYEADRAEGSYLTSGTTKNEYVTIDGDWFDGNNVYSFYVRAVCDDSYSEWDACYYLYCVLPDEIGVNEALFLFDSEGGRDYISLTSTVKWTASVVGDWIDINKASGSGDDKIRIDVEENTGEFRVGTISIKSSLGTIVVEVRQEAGVKPILEIDRKTINVSSEEEYYNFYVTSNIYGWSVYSDEDWIDSLSNSSFNGNSWINFSVDENKSIEPRTGTITVTGGGITKTVTVTQDGRPAIVGDINNDGEITNKDRFLLNRYLANMAGYTNIDKTLADINGDGSVTDVDAEYLSRHLAGWAGYEKLPEINTGTSGCAHTQYTDTYYNTVYVSDTIKTNTTHTYYHVYNRKCSCGMDIGKVQSELITEAHSYVNNLCACGAYNDASYEKWTGVNVSDMQANVYSTPSATVRYGYINKNEVVTVIGEYGDKYLIEYTLDGGNGVKQGYIVKSAITSFELVERENLIEEIEKTFFDPRSQYERYDDLAKDEISINFFDLMFADITDLGGVIEKCLDLGDADIVNSKHAIVTLMECMDDEIYYEKVSECADVTICLYEWIKKTPIEDITKLFEETSKNSTSIIKVISDIKGIEIDNINNELSQYIEFLYQCGLDEDAVMERYAEILVMQNGNLDIKAAYKKVGNAAESFGTGIGAMMKKLQQLGTATDVLYSIYNVAIKDYSVELAKLNVLESAFQPYRYDHLYNAVRELKAEMENKFDGIIKEAKGLALDIAIDYVFEKSFGLWGIVSAAVGVTMGQDAMAKRDACYILEMEDAIYWHIKSLMSSYQENGDVAIVEKLQKALHAYTDCKTTLNALAIELNTWGVFVTSREKDQYGLTKYDYLSVYKYWYTQQHDDIDALFVEFGCEVR